MVVFSQASTVVHVISQWVFKGSLERFSSALNAMGFIVVIELVVVGIWVFDAKKQF